MSMFGIVQFLSNQKNEICSLSTGSDKFQRRRPDPSQDLNINGKPLTSKEVVNIQWDTMFRRF